MNNKYKTHEDTKPYYKCMCERNIYTFAYIVALSLVSASTQVHFVNVMDTVSFNCEVNGIPLPFANWSMSAQRIPINAISSGRASVTTTIVNSDTILSILTIRSVQLNDAGLYICTGINGEISNQAYYNMTTGKCIYVSNNTHILSHL